MLQPAAAPRAVRAAPPSPLSVAPSDAEILYNENKQARLSLERVDESLAPAAKEEYELLCQRHDRHERELEVQIQKQQEQQREQQERELMVLEKARERQEQQRQQQLQEQKHREELERLEAAAQERELMRQRELQEQARRAEEQYLDLERQREVAEHRFRAQEWRQDQQWEEEQRRAQEQRLMEGNQLRDQGRQRDQHWEEEECRELEQLRLAQTSIKSVVTNVRASETFTSSPSSAAPPDIKLPAERLVSVRKADSGSSEHTTESRSSLQQVVESVMPERPMLSPPPQQPMSEQPTSSNQHLLQMAANQVVVESDSEDDDEIHTTPRAAPRKSSQPWPQLRVLNSFPGQGAQTTKELVDAGPIGDDVHNSIGASMAPRTAMPDPPSPSLAPAAPPDRMSPRDESHHDEEAGAPLPPVMLDQEVTDDLFLKAMGFHDHSEWSNGVQHYVEGAAVQKPRTPAFTAAPHPRAGAPAQHITCVQGNCMSSVIYLRSVDEILILSYMVLTFCIIQGVLIFLIFDCWWALFGNRAAGVLMRLPPLVLSRDCLLLFYLEIASSCSISRLPPLVLSRAVFSFRARLSLAIALMLPPAPVRD